MISLEVYIEETKVNRIIASSIVCLVIAYASVSFRLAAKRLSRTSLQADDWWILASLVSKKSTASMGSYLTADSLQIFTTTYFGLLLSMVPLGFGRHEILSKHIRRFMIVCRQI